MYTILACDQIVLLYSNTPIIEKHHLHCEYGAIVDTQHFLLNCNLLQNFARRTFNISTTFCQQPLNVLLRDNANFSEEENKTFVLQFKILS